MKWLVGGEEMAGGDERGRNGCNDEEGAAEIDKPFFAVPAQVFMCIEQSEIEVCLRLTIVDQK